VNRLNRIRIVPTLLATAALVLASTSANASWVQGYAGVFPGATIDPLYQSGPFTPLAPTVSTGQFTDAQKSVYSQADIGNGALRASLAAAGSGVSLTANPRLGETVSFRNDSAETSTWNFSYDVDGTVTSGSTPIPIIQDFGGAGSFRTTYIQFAVHIFAGHTVGPVGSANAWNTHLSSALFSQTKDMTGFPTSGNLSSFNADLTDSISGSLPLPTGVNEFDVVLVLNLTAGIPSTTNSSINMDFTHTAQFGVDSSAPFSSDTGYFLTGNNVVPEPATALAVIPLFVASRRRK
jgi:hypothetical protein